MNRLLNPARAHLPSLRRGLLLAVIAGLAGLAPSSRADTLSAFINTPTTITQDDKQFTGDNTRGISVLATGGATFNPTLVSVTGIPAPPTNPDLGPGLRYQSANQFSANPGQTLDVAFSYSATATGGNLIHDISMTLQSGAATGNAVIKITESAFADAAHTMALGTRSVLVTQGQGFNMPFDLVLIMPVTTVYVSKDIALDASTGGQATFSIMDQNFSQVAAVPEPGTIAMALGGLPVLGMFWVRRRRA